MGIYVKEKWLCLLKWNIELILCARSSLCV